VVGPSLGEEGQKAQKEAHLGEEDQVAPLGHKPFEEAHPLGKPPPVQALGPLRQEEGLHPAPLSPGFRGVAVAHVPLFQKALHPPHPKPRGPGQSGKALRVAHIPKEPQGPVQVGVGMAFLEGEEDLLPLLEGHRLLQDPGLPQEV
jgi:hypothetical protein